MFEVLIILLFSIGNSDNRIPELNQIQKLKLFTNQQHTIKFEEQYQKADISSTLCTFQSSEPDLVEVSSVLLHNSISNQASTLLNRLRTLEDNQPESLIMLDNCLMVLESNKMNVFQNRQGKLTKEAQYTLNQLNTSINRYIVKLKSEVFIVSGHTVFKCTKVGYSTSKISIQAGPAVSTADNQIVMVVNNVMYQLEKEKDGTLITKRVFNLEMYEKMSNSSNIRFQKCKTSQSELFCLDMNNGLFIFDLKNLNFKSKISKTGCRDFLFPLNQSQPFTFDCIFQKQTYLTTYPAIDKPILSPYYLSEIHQIEGSSNYLVVARKSKIIFYNRKFPGKKSQIKFNEKIKDFQIKKEIDSGLAIFYILFKDRIVKYHLKFLESSITCHSAQPVDIKIIFQFTDQDNRQYSSTLVLEVVEVEQLDHTRWIFTILIILVMGLGIALFFVYYYENVEARLKRIYTTLREQRIKKQLKPI